MPREPHSHAHRVTVYPTHAPKRHHAEGLFRRGSGKATNSHHANGSNGCANGTECAEAEYAEYVEEQLAEKRALEAAGLETGPHGSNGHGHGSNGTNGANGTAGDSGEVNTANGGKGKGPPRVRKPHRSATQMAGEDLYVRLNDRDDFWSEIEALLELPEGCDLVMLDNTIRMFVTICGAYHDKYLRDQHEMNLAIGLLLSSELFTYYRERMVGIMMGDAQENTNPHELYIWYHIILNYGQRHPSLFRSHRRWYKLLPTLGEVVGMDYEENFILGLPSIETRLRLPATNLMYEVCRVQRLNESELAIFDDRFIDHLFDLVETTRNNQDESLNWAVIRLICALNEQFMVATLPKKKSNPASASTRDLPSLSEHYSPERRARAQSASPAPQTQDLAEDGKKHNRVLVVLMRRLGSSKTFGENVIFMLNRSENTQSGLCLKLLILKILYLLFTTEGTSEYFYLNDLRVLLDVFIRELVDLDEDHEALRHTYLRVLYPLMAFTQMKHDPYKREQIKLVLRSLVGNQHFKDVNLTTKRLVERCLRQAEQPIGDLCLGSVKDALPSGSGSGFGGPGEFDNPADAEKDTAAKEKKVGSMDSYEATTRARLGVPGAGSNGPMRNSSLVDLSKTLEERGDSLTPLDRSQTSTPTERKPRRKAPAPPTAKRKHSVTSTTSSTSVASDGPSGWITFSA